MQGRREEYAYAGCRGGCVQGRVCMCMQERGGAGEGVCRVAFYCYDYYVMYVCMYVAWGTKGACISDMGSAAEPTQAVVVAAAVSL